MASNDVSFAQAEFFQLKHEIASLCPSDFAGVSFPFRSESPSIFAYDRLLLLEIIIASRRIHTFAFFFAFFGSDARTWGTGVRVFFLLGAR